MTAQEKRQALRIIRNARELERYTFELIEELQVGRIDDQSVFCWGDTENRLDSIACQLHLLRDLVRNIKEAVA